MRICESSSRFPDGSPARITTRRRERSLRASSMIVVRRFWLSWPLLFLLDIIHPSYHPDSLTSTDYSKSSTFVDPLIRLDEPFFPPLSPGSLSLLRPVSGLGPDLASSSHASPYNYPNGSNTSTSTVTAPNRSTATITAAPLSPHASNSAGRLNGMSENGAQIYDSSSFSATESRRLTPHTMRNGKRSSGQLLSGISKGLGRVVTVMRRNAPDSAVSNMPSPKNPDLCLGRRNTIFSKGSDEREEVEAGDPDISGPLNTVVCICDVMQRKTVADDTSMTSTYPRICTISRQPGSQRSSHEA